MGETTYLLHFREPYKHARHYLGSSRDLDARLAEHRAGRGARLVSVITDAGIDFIVTRTWPGGRHRERSLKRQHSGLRLCPLCRGFMSGVEVCRLMRSHDVTIRTLADTMGEPRRVVNAVRQNGVKGVECVRDWFEAITGVDLRQGHG